MFLESILFLQKLSKSSKTMFPCFGDSVASWSNRMPQSRAHTEIFCDSLVGQCPSHEIYLEYFSKFGFLMFLTGLSSDLFTGGRFSRKGYTEIFVAYIATSSQVELPIAKNTSKNFPFVLSVLVTSLSDLLAT